jgi:hypothetical protein
MLLESDHDRRVSHTVGFLPPTPLPLEVAVLVEVEVLVQGVFFVARMSCVVDLGGLGGAVESLVEITTNYGRDVRNSV